MKNIAGDVLGQRCEERNLSLNINDISDSCSFYSDHPMERSGVWHGIRWPVVYWSL